MFRQNFAKAIFGRLLWGLGGGFLGELFVGKIGKWYQSIPNTERFEIGSRREVGFENRVRGNLNFWGGKYFQTSKILNKKFKINHT